MALRTAVVFVYGAPAEGAQSVIAQGVAFGQVDPFGLGSWQLFYPSLFYGSDIPTPLEVSLALIDPLMRLYRLMRTVVPPPHDPIGRFTLEGTTLVWGWFEAQHVVNYNLED